VAPPTLAKEPAGDPPEPGGEFALGLGGLGRPGPETQSGRSSNQNAPTPHRGHLAYCPNASGPVCAYCGVVGEGSGAISFWVAKGYNQPSPIPKLCFSCSMRFLPGPPWTFDDSCWATAICFGWPVLWLMSHGVSGLLGAQRPGPSHGQPSVGACSKGTIIQYPDGAASPTAIRAERSCYLARTPGLGRDQTLEGRCVVS
jgi:hypothetical protein